MADDGNCKDCVSRRLFLLSTARALGAAAVLVPLPMVGCGPGGPGTTGGGTGSSGTGGTSGGGSSGTSTSGGSGGQSDGGCSKAVCQIDANTFILILANHPELQSVGGIGIFTDNRYTDPICGQNAFAVAQPEAGKFVAFSASCTHACCTVQPQSGGFFCRCHGSTFDITGAVTRGPAGQSLPPLPVCFDGCKIYVQLA